MSLSDSERRYRERLSQLSKERQEKAEDDMLEKVLGEFKKEESDIEAYRQKIEQFDIDRQTPEFFEKMDLDESFTIVNKYRWKLSEWENGHEEVKEKLKAIIKIKTEKIEEELRIMEEEEENEEERQEKFERSERLRVIGYATSKLSEMSSSDFKSGRYRTCPNCKTETRFTANDIGKLTCSKCGFILGVSK